MKEIRKQPEEIAVGELVNSAGGNFVGFQLAKAALTMISGAVLNISHNLTTPSKRKRSRFYKLMAGMWISSLNILS